MVNVGGTRHPFLSLRTPGVPTVVTGRPVILTINRPAVLPYLPIRATFGVSGAWIAENASIQLRPGSAEFDLSDRTTAANSGSRRGVN